MIGFAFFSTVENFHRWYSLCNNPKFFNCLDQTVVRPDWPYRTRRSCPHPQITFLVTKCASWHQPAQIREEMLESGNDLRNKCIQKFITKFYPWPWFYFVYYEKTEFWNHLMGKNSSLITWIYLFPYLENISMQKLENFMRIFSNHNLTPSTWRKLVYQHHSIEVPFNLVSRIFPEFRNISIKNYKRFN